MIGLGTLLSSVAIVLGGLNGHFTGKLFQPSQQEALKRTCGVSVLFLGIAGAMEGMLRIENAAIASHRSILIFCIGVNLIWGKKLRVANMLPAILFAILAAYLPWGF